MYWLRTGFPRIAIGEHDPSDNRSPIHRLDCLQLLFSSYKHWPVDPPSSNKTVKGCRKSVLEPKEHDLFDVSWKLENGGLMTFIISESTWTILNFSPWNPVPRSPCRNHRWFSMDSHCEKLLLIYWYKTLGKWWTSPLLPIDGWARSGLTPSHRLLPLVDTRPNRKSSS